MSVTNYKYLYLYRAKKFYFCLDNGNQTHLDLAINNGFQSVDSHEPFNKCTVTHDTGGAGDGLSLLAFVSKEDNDRIADDYTPATVVNTIAAALAKFSSIVIKNAGAYDVGKTLEIVTGQFAGPDLSGQNLS